MKDPERTSWPGWALPVLTVAWFGCFLYLGLASRLPDIPGLTGRGEEVALSGHFLTTLVLAVLFYALIRARNLDRPTVAVAMAVIVLAAFAGGVIEVLQSFSTVRQPELTDWLFDGFGAATAVGVLAFIDRKRALRPRLVTGAHVLGLLATSVTISAFFIFPPAPAGEAAAYCPAGVEQRRVPVEPLVPGTGARVTDGVVVLYTFEESADDVSGVTPSLDLALGGGASLGDGWLRLAGDDGVAKSEGPADKIFDAVSNAFTVEAWVRPDDLLQSGPARIVSTSRGTSLSDVNFHLGQERTCLSFRVSVGGGAAEWLLTESVFTTPQPAWHVAVTFDKGTIRAYVDGRLVEQQGLDREDGSDSWDPTMPLLVGNEATLDRPFRGDIHLVAIYARALTAAEVARNHTAGAVLGGG